MVDKALSTALQNMQNVVTGLFKPRFHDQYIPAVGAAGTDTLICIEIGNLLGLSTLHIQKTEGHYVHFPDDKSLTEMMEDPIWFNEWYKENVPKTNPEKRRY